MREYGQIQCSYWQKASEEAWSNDATLLGAYLLTGPHSNGVGCYRLPDGYVSDDLGWSPERVSKGFQELFAKGFCNRFGTVVLIPKFLRWNPISNGNVAKARAVEFEAIPSDEAKTAAALVLLEFGNHWDNGFRSRLETLSKGLGKGYAKQNPTQSNPEITQQKNCSEPASPPREPLDVPREPPKPAALIPGSPPFIELTTNTGKPWPVFPELVADWKSLFPAVDVEQQLRQMKAWLDANPAKRKTETGMKRFAVSWLTRMQDRGGSIGMQNAMPASVHATVTENSSLSIQELGL